MIENQSDNVEKKEENVSDESNVSESSSVIEDKISDDKESVEIDDEKIDVVIISSGLDGFSYGKRPSHSIKKRLQ